MPKYVGNKEAIELIGVCTQTLYALVEQGKLEAIRLPGGKRLYNIEKYIRDNLVVPGVPKPEDTVIEGQVKIIYCRVSSRGQKDDLDRQIAYLRQKCPDHELITDIGSGLNFKRHGLLSILERAIKGEVSEVAIAYKDRLARFGFELIDWIIRTYSKGKIVVLSEETQSPGQELVSDLLSIITVFGAKVNGLRKYKHAIEKDTSLAKFTIEETTESAIMEDKTIPNTRTEKGPTKLV